MEDKGKIVRSCFRRVIAATRLLAVPLCLVVAWSAPAVTGQGKIVYASDASGDYEIWIMDEHGRHKNRLTSYPGTQEMEPHLSPDGTQIAFKSCGGLGCAVWVMDVDGLNQRLIRDYGTGVSIYEWTASDWLLLAVNSLPGCFKDDVRRLRPDGTDEEIIVAEQSHGATESRGGSRVVWVKSVPCWTPLNEIHAMDADGLNDFVILEADGQAEFWTSYAHNSDRVVFSQSDSAAGYTPPSNIYTMNDDGTDLRRITSAVGADDFLVPVFSPDDSRIVAAFSSGGDLDVVTFPADGGPIRFIAASAANETDPDWGLVPATDDEDDDEDEDDDDDDND